ncbi:MAG TPA: 3'-5' exonuclease, partial [Burkholderiaceae bacterium]|nr:3'-5' exonuclease [Burkholderiaceae bacterium]
HPGRLFAAMTTALIGCDATEVAALADDEPRVLALVERFCGYRDSWRARGFGTMFRRWLRDDGIDSRLLARRDGERRLTNLLHLAELLQDTAASAMAPEALVRWLADRRDAPPADEELALRLESDQNLVQIVTIHKSKGLEYDVVFCPFLWTKPPAPRQPDDWREYHDADGRLVLDFRPQARDDPAIRQRCVREHHAESLRLIYVAMTRAIHRCYLVAGLYHESPGGSEPRIGDSASCLLNWLVDDSRTAFDDWLTAAKAPQAIEASWHRFAHTLGSACRLETLAADPAAAAAPLPAPELELQPPPAPPPVPLPWRIGSFSGLAHGAADDAAAAADHDARAIAADESRADSPVAADDFLRFPRGASAGDCLHAAFERAEFTDPASWGPAVERALAAHPQRLPKLDDAEAQPLLKAMLSNALSNALTARLPGGLTLASVPPRSRRVELAFHLPAAGVRDAPLQSLLGDHGYAVAPLRFEPLDGYLNGYIDLVFEHAGRYYIVDWKSNHLGWRRDDYEAASIAQAMRANRYPLQYLLYALALHRHLGRRLPGYDYERHFGGVYYLFVRGLRPQWSGDRNNAPGVLFDRPRRDTIGALDALIGGAAS